MTSVTSFACLQKLALRDASIALNNQLHVRCARMGAQSSAGRVLVLSLGIGLVNTTLLAGIDIKSIPVEWTGLTVLKSILPW